MGTLSFGGFKNSTSVSFDSSCRCFEILRRYIGGTFNLKSMLYLSTPWLLMHYLKCFLERSVEGDLSSPVIFAAKLTPNANISERLEAGMPSLMIMFFPKLSLFTFRKSIIEVIVGPGVRQTPFCGSQTQENLLFCLHFLIQPRLRRWRTFC